ncbi:hypothetical protein BofuT4_uP002760.1 [Botrytis cinerea T4]|uniref:Uncharacterized protein n=1 Tax=Botryotinia fuckeliana (strain T4) TaxID=999810 RepID=G2Y377_BOTF4|nr:hypothetical protein BofuT4_uP002760.1 [Botrytis cinerea T4]
MRTLIGPHNHTNGPSKNEPRGMQCLSQKPEHKDLLFGFRISSDQRGS